MIVLTVALWLPEINALIPDHDLSFVVYLTAQQVVGVVLCMALAARRGWLSYGVAGAVWFTTQAVDEATNGNLWREQQWEYPLAALLILAAWLARNARS